MNRHDRKMKKDRTDDLDPDLLTHIQSLGLATVEDYLGWCARHGFSRRTDKHWKVRLKERSYSNRAIAEARLAQKKQELRKPEKIIERIFGGELHEADVTQPHFKAIWFLGNGRGAVQQHARRQRAEHPHSGRAVALHEADGPPRHASPA
jgi:hypothetical protein